MFHGPQEFLEKVMIADMINYVPASHEIRIFITEFTRDGHWHVSCVS
jgi:hypothetical protein